MADFVQQAIDNQLPEPFIEYLRTPSSYLNLFGAQKFIFKNRITDEILQKIAQILIEIQPQHLVLDLGCNLLTDKCATSIIQLLPFLYGLSLRSNQITELFCQEIKSDLQQSSINYLSLSENNLGSVGTEMLMEAIAHGYQLSYGVAGERSQPYGCLQYLDLKKTGFSEPASVWLERILVARFCGLRELQLSELSGECQRRLALGISYNTSIEALTIKGSEFDLDIIKNLVTEVAIDGEELEEKDVINKRINDMKRIQQRQTQRQDLPKPLPKSGAYLRLSVTPLRFLDLTGCKGCFDICYELKEHLAKQESVLTSIILDGVNIKNQGASLLAEALLKYQFRTPQNDFYINCNGQSVINNKFELFGFIDTDESYDQHYKNITFQQFNGPQVALINLSLKRCGIKGQGLSTIALLAKYNDEVAYISLDQNDFDTEKGDTVNAQKVWYPKLEWETTFSVRSQTKRKIVCDFGLKRTADLTQIQYYREYSRILKALSLFE
ncbi:hypothetical protein SS50377_22485 [Spironucleus salmonicida]|uniref:Leucine rich repeat-containing protein n=1 Tax=Spironucleus salmonicida TaxID=348837 RepID=V6LMS9_9EUKA|nr:hypothetical protein SS50377_22485 [Spironucleus salmonicida]|eukprot:EST42024.1 hypothetical protein SS50377_18331 [Spironucleus salmonicida]